MCMCVCVYVCVFFLLQSALVLIVVFIAALVIVFVSIAAVARVASLITTFTHTHTHARGDAHMRFVSFALSLPVCARVRVCVCVYMLSFAGRLTVWFHTFVVVLTFACFYTHCVLHVYPYKRRRRRQCALRCALRSHLLFVWHLFWESRVRESVLCLCRSLSLTRSHLPYFVIRFHFVFIHIRLARCFTHYASRHFSGSTSSRGLLLPPGCSRRCCCCAAVNLRSCLRSFFFLFLLIFFCACLVFLHRLAPARYYVYAATVIVMSSRASYV